MQRSDAATVISFADLLPGDIFAFSFHGVPHTGIYAPKEGCQGDIIHMYFDKERMGAIRSTLSKILLMNHDVYIFRHRQLDGAALAKQAEHWLEQGIEYSKPRLAESLMETTDAEAADEDNLLNYLLIAARRETIPVKTHQFPCPPTSRIADIGLTMLLPDFIYFRPQLYIGAMLAMYGANNPDRPKGLTCIAFVLSCLAAVALQDDIAPVNAMTGWKSRKDFTEAEIQQFDFARIREKLSPSIAKLNPHKPSPYEFYHILNTDETYWQKIGVMDKTITKTFDKQAYQQEQVALIEKIKENRAQFLRTFGEKIFNRDPDRPYRHFTLFNEPKAEEEAMLDNSFKPY